MCACLPLTIYNGELRSRGGKIHGFQASSNEIPNPQASEASDHGLCEKLWAQLPSLGLEPQDSESGSPGMVSLRSGEVRNR